MPATIDIIHTYLHRLQPLQRRLHIPLIRVVQLCRAWRALECDSDNLAVLVLAKVPNTLEAASIAGPASRAGNALWDLARRAARHASLDLQLNTEFLSVDAEVGGSWTSVS